MRPNGAFEPALDLNAYSFESLKRKWRDGACELLDAHCHISFAGNAEEVSQRLRGARVACFSNTVTPGEFVQCEKDFASHPGVRVGLGLHPWWLLDGQCGADDIALFEELAVGRVHIGEIGLDFGRKYNDAAEANRATMIDGFERAIAACMKDDCDRRILSIHSVRSAGMVLDVLEQTGCAKRHACVLHWFSGTSDELQRAIKLGCWFSIGKSMLQQKRGRAYAKAIPENRLLLETDAPSEPVRTFDAEEQIADLHDSFKELLELRFV